jgi:N4-gp56 family major capsid protein
MQVWAVNSLGGFMYSDELSDILRTALQPIVRFRQFCDAKDATDKGLGKGDLFHWNVYSDVAEGGEELEELEAMPETSFEIEQGSLTVAEYGNSVPYSGKLDNLSKQPVSEIIHKVLKNDAKKTLDGAAHAQFNETPLTVTPTSGTHASAVTFEEGGCTITNNVAMGKDHIKSITDGMKERSIPPYMNDDYFAIGWPTTFRTVKNNLEDIHKYVETGFTKIMNGEIGRYEGVRFVEQTNIA